MYWVEIRTTQRRAGRPKLVPLEDAYNHRGFRSVFAFDDETAEIIRQTGTTSNLRGINVYADTLFFDFDDHDPVDFRNSLRVSGFAYSEWHSGGRSVHFHLKLVPCYGSWVPQACKNWTKAHAPTADTSFLHPTGIYRLPHTFHSKHAGRRKELVFEQAGSALSLERPPVLARTGLVSETSPDHFYFLLTANKRPGERSGHIWLLATIAAEGGIGIEDALDKIRFWNSLQSQPQTEKVIIQQTINAYKHSERRPP